MSFVASSGDDAVPGKYPAYSPYVLAVGGTALTIDPHGLYGGEIGWDHSGAGSAPSNRSRRIKRRSNPPSSGPFLTCRSSPAPRPRSRLITRERGWADRLWVYRWHQFSRSHDGGTDCPGNQGRKAASQPPLNSNGAARPTPRFMTYPRRITTAPDNSHVSNGTTAAGITDPARYNEITGLGTPEANLLVPALIAYTPLTLTIPGSTLPHGTKGSPLTPITISAGGGSGTTKNISYHVIWPVSGRSRSRLRPLCPATWSSRAPRPPPAHSLRRDGHR